MAEKDTQAEKSRRGRPRIQRPGAAVKPEQPAINPFQLDKAVVDYNVFLYGADFDPNLVEKKLLDIQADAFNAGGNSPLVVFDRLAMIAEHSAIKVEPLRPELALSLREKRDSYKAILQLMTATSNTPVNAPSAASQTANMTSPKP